MIFIGYTIRLSANPEEAVHFLEYGVLGLLIYRALTHRVKDVSIYFMALMIGAMVGMMDEAIQWVTPKRFWGLNDIWLNFFAVGLTQVAFAKGLRPSIISGRPGALNTQTFRSSHGSSSVILNRQLAQYANSHRLVR